MCLGVTKGYPVGSIGRSQRQSSFGRRPNADGVNAIAWIPPRSTERPRPLHGLAGSEPCREPLAGASPPRPSSHPEPPPTRPSRSTSPTITTGPVAAILSAAVARSAAIAATAFEPQLLHGRHAHSPLLTAPPPRHRWKDSHPPCSCRRHQASIQGFGASQHVAMAASSGVAAALRLIGACSMKRDSNEPPDWPSEAPLALRMASPGALFAFLGAPEMAAASLVLRRVSCLLTCGLHYSPLHVKLSWLVWRPGRVK